MYDFEELHYLKDLSFIEKIVFADNLIMKGERIEDDPDSIS